MPDIFLLRNPLAANLSLYFGQVLTDLLSESQQNRLTYLEEFSNM